MSNLSGKKIWNGQTLIKAEEAWAAYVASLEAGEDFGIVLDDDGNVSVRA